MRLAGTMNMYSKKAMSQLKAITPIRGNAANQLNSCFIFKCPYHANVMNEFDTMRSNIVYIPFISGSFGVFCMFRFLLSGAKLAEFFAKFPRYKSYKIGL